MKYSFSVKDVQYGWELWLNNKYICMHLNTAYIDTVAGREVNKLGDKKIPVHSELRVLAGEDQAKHAHFTAIPLAGMQSKLMR